MTKTQEIEVRQSEVREKINGLLSLETRTEAQDVELRTLTTEAMKLEPELRAAKAAEPEPDTGRPVGDSESRERAEIRSRTGIADYLRATISGVEVRGAAAEFASSLGIGAFQRLPLALFAQFAPQPETRAITGGPAVDGMVQTAINFVFQRTAAAALGVQFPSHGPGKAQIPRVTAAPPADTLAKDAAAPSTAATITLDSKDPERVSGQFEIRIEDMAVYPPLEATLMETIRGSIANEVDKELINDLFTAAADVSVASATETYGTAVSRFAALVDGLHAYGMSDIRGIIGSSTFAAYMALYQGNGSVPVADYLTEMLGGLRTSNRVPALASNGQKGLVVLGASGDPIRSYVWNALEIIRDPFSGAGAGRVTITATALLSSPHVPHGTAMLKEIHPKLS